MALAFRRDWILCLCAALPALPAMAAGDEPMALKDWVTPGAIASMQIAPDGKRVAGITSGKSTAAFVLDLENDQSTLVAKWAPDRRYLYGAWPLAVNWVANDLLAVDYSTRESVSVDLKGQRKAELGERFIRRLTERGDASDWVLAYRDIDDGDIDAVNARNGERRKYRVGLPGKLVQWAFDPAGALRAVTMMDTAFWAEKTKISNWYRADEKAPWQLLEESPITNDHWVPLRVPSEPDALVILSRQGRDTYAVFRYDTQKRQQVELMAGHAQEDILAVTGLDQPTFEMVTTAGIKARIAWFDERWARLQSAVDQALPNRINRLQGDKNGRLLVSSYADVDPGRWYVLETQTLKMRLIAEARPRIDPKRMRPMETVRYTARDGLVVNAYLTLPAPDGAAAPPPLVVLIHGGPNVRDRWEWNEEVQLLASRGYAVFQPQFRGSSGFGRRFQEAGYGQWGRAMQDDITDGVQHLIAEKRVDPRRICIYGASYGGYAALWGTIKTPQLYRCGISFAGVGDLGEMLTNSLFDDSNPASRELLRARVGDPAQARQLLDDVSPLKHVAQVQVPLLIAHGDDDVRVLPSQSKDMVKALKALDKPVEWMLFEGEGHGLASIDSRIRYYTALLDFLKRHIGKPDPAAPQPEVAR